MDFGIGLPNAVGVVERVVIVDWSRRAEQAGFSSVGVLDRIAYANYESLICLAAAAAVTDRVRLVTDILISPLRANAALLAKQAATIDVLSGGRLVLGLAPGGRADDYDVSGVDFESRGRAFDRQLAELAKFWDGEVVGPDPVNGKRPTLLIGGSSDRAFRRVVEHGDGWTMGGGTPETLSGGLTKLYQAWEQAGRDGRPRAIALFYFVLGDDAEEVARRSLGDYYSFLGDYAERVVQSAAKDRDTINQYLSGFEQAGADEVICFPASSDPNQVELLAEAVGL